MKDLRVMCVGGSLMVAKDREKSKGVVATPPVVPWWQSMLTHVCIVDASILINWKSPFPILGMSGYFVNFILFLQDFPVSKQCRPWSDAAFWSGLHCLPRSQKWDARLIWVKKLRWEDARANLHVACTQMIFAFFSTKVTTVLFVSCIPMLSSYISPFELKWTNTYVWLSVCLSAIIVQIFSFPRIHFIRYSGKSN